MSIKFALGSIYTKFNLYLLRLKIDTKYYMVIKIRSVMNDTKVVATVFVLITLAISIQLML